MDHFSLFGLPVEFRIEPARLRSRYLELSRQFHPDYYASAGETEQAQALEKSAQLNRAYRIFQNPDETIKYVLMLKGLLEEEEKYSLSPEFLMEVMEINESLMDLEPDGLPVLKEKIAGLEKTIYAPVAPIIEGYQEGVTTTEELLAVKEYYYRKKYLDRIKTQLSEMH